MQEPHRSITCDQVPSVAAEVNTVSNTIRIYNSIIIIQVDIQTNVHANVPARALGWEDNFKIPKQYDIEIMAMIEKKQITPKVRSHVVREVAARMLDHCLYPTKNQYQVISAKVVQEFPVLADTRIGTGYVSNQTSCTVISFIDQQQSIEGQLRTRFKNIRKIPSRIGLTLTKPPPVKKLRLEIKHPATSKAV